MYKSGQSRGFTIVELLIVIVVIGILAAITIVAFNGVQARARDASRIAKIQSITDAIELYRVDNGQYPPIQDAQGTELSGCGSATDNWGHCDRWQILANYLSPYMRLDPVSLSDATQAPYSYYYTSQAADNYQTYGMHVFLEGSGGQSDNGFFSNSYEVGPKVRYCMEKYTTNNRNWTTYATVCQGGN